MLSKPVLIILFLISNPVSAQTDAAAPAQPTQQAPAAEQAPAADQAAPAKAQQSAPAETAPAEGGTEATTIQQVPMTIPVPIPIPQGAPQPAQPQQAVNPGGQMYTPNLPSPNVIDTNENAPPPSATITIPRNPPTPELSASERQAQAMRAQDDRLRELIRTKIYRDNAGFAKTVTINVTGGKVLLQGQVLNNQDKLLIERTAKKEAGDTNVTNQLITIEE